MASDPRRFPAEFFDGETAATRPVEVAAEESALVFETGGRRRSWSLAGLAPVERLRIGSPLRLTHDSERAARLVVPASEAPWLAARAPQLLGGINARHALRIAAIVAACLVALAGAGYAVLTLAPQTLAFVIPESWRDRLGEQTEASFVSGAKRCDGPAGVAALQRLATRTVSGLDDPPDFSVRVYDMPMTNAFALPGGRIVLTGPLIRNARSPDEVAGVLAHELGHVALRHPEAQLVRVFGLQLLLSIASGGSADTLGSLAGLLAILRYTRSAEQEADDYAQDTLEKARIDPLALRRFLESVRKSEPGDDAGMLATIGSIFATHPGIEERIERMRPLPDGAPRQVLDEAEWQALRKICG